MKSLAKKILIGLVLLVAAGFLWPWLASETWRGMEVSPQLEHGEGASPETALGVWLGADEPETDVEVRFEWRVGDESWQPITEHGYQMWCPGLGPRWWSKPVETAGVVEAEAEWVEGPPRPRLSVASYRGPTRVSRMFLNDSVRVAPGLLLAVDGVQLRTTKLLSERGFEWSLFGFVNVSNWARGVRTDTLGEITPWPAGARWNGEAPRLVGTTEEREAFTATFEVPVRIEDRPATVELRWTLLPLPGRLDDEEAFEEFFAAGPRDASPMDFDPLGHLR